MTTSPHIEFHVAEPAEYTRLGHPGGRPVIYIGWIFTGDQHPSEVRAQGGLVTFIPRINGRPGDIDTMRSAWDMPGRDHVWTFQTRGDRTGWFGVVYVYVNVDDTIAQIMAHAEATDSAEVQR